MMKGYIKNNQADKVVDLFKRIKNPDEIIIILLFNACAQLGTEEALNSIKQVSSKIVQSFQSNSRLLTSLLDGLVKCGDITYAKNLFNTFKNKTVSMYKVMINGFLKENNCLKVLSLFNQIKMNNIEIDHIIWTCIIKCLSEIGDGDFSQSIVILKYIMPSSICGLIQMEFFLIFFVL
ncbi:unnamed protein product [Rotaria socialis]